MARLVCRATGIIVEATEEAVEALSASGFDRVDMPAPKAVESKSQGQAPEKPDTDGMTIKQLSEWCSENGVPTKKGWKRSDFIEAIESF